MIIIFVRVIMRVIFIGGGNMAQAIFAVLDNYAIVVVQKNPNKINELRLKFSHIEFVTKLDFNTGHDDLIILAVKPQDAKIACLEIRDKIRSSVVVSIMAGINVSRLSNWLDNSKIVRIMVNVPCKFKLGVNGIYYTPEIENYQRKNILGIFDNIGKTFVLNDEDSIDKITAIASSAPAYIFYFIESLIDSAVNQFGFTQELALAITMQVVNGSIAMIEQTPQLDIKQLREQITSKNGTTEASINVFKTLNLKNIISQAEKACYLRAKELAQISDEEMEK